MLLLLRGSGGDVARSDADPAFEDAALDVVSGRQPAGNEIAVHGQAAMVDHLIAPQGQEEIKSAHVEAVARIDGVDCEPAPLGLALVPVCTSAGAISMRRGSAGSSERNTTSAVKLRSVMVSERTLSLKLMRKPPRCSFEPMNSLMKSRQR